jgi:hypothetical protein
LVCRIPKIALARHSERVRNQRLGREVHEVFDREAIRLEEERTQRVLEEEFAWSERDSQFVLVRKYEQLHVKSKTCDFVTEVGSKDMV